MANSLVEGVQQWAAFVAKCLAERLSVEKFEAFAPFYHARTPLPPAFVAELFLRPQPTNHYSLDPRVPQYLEVLRKLGYVDSTSVLKALYRYSTSHTLAEPDGAQPDGNGLIPVGGGRKPRQRWTRSYAAEEIVFYSVTKAVAQGKAIQTNRAALAMARLVGDWMALFYAASTAFATEVLMGKVPQAREDMESARAGFVALLLHVLEHPLVLRALAQRTARDLRRSLGENLAHFVPTIRPEDASPEILTRLEMIRTDTLTALEPVGRGGGGSGNGQDTADAEMMEELLDRAAGVDGFPLADDVVIPNSRAGLYIFLAGCLVGRPLLVDDATAFLGFLRNRYGGDTQTAAVDLILASFDVMANAAFRHEGQPAAHLLRSYLVNKLPLLLTGLAAPTGNPAYQPLAAEYCITAALAQIDTNAFPTLSGIFDDSRAANPLTDSVREDFVVACCVHGLVPESSIERLLGERSFQTLPEGGRLVKEDLVQRCVSDPESMLDLIKQLENMDGNVGAVCQALTEVLGQLCRNKETISLKLLCSQLAQKPLSLDVMLLFEKPYTILHPLCELLDGWKYDEDQNEYQPIYEEFGSILLLLLAFAYRYGLTPAELGVRPPDSFVAKLLVRGHLSRPLEELSAQESEHIGGWIRGLFDTETGGLGDDLMSSCPPQDFYLLVPTLFHQIVLAFATGHLSEEGLKGGVEYLVDTFLLPSLVTAITYLSSLLWIDKSQDQKAIIKILQLIVLPSSISNEAQTMLTSVLNIVAKPLEHQLRAYQRREPKTQETEPLLRALKENIPLSRRAGASSDHNELEAWSGTQGGGVGAALRHTMQGFVQWSVGPAPNVMPTSYTHRQVLVAVRLLGARRVVNVIVDEVVHQITTGAGGGGALVYDVAAALICAPDVSNDASAAGALQPPPGAEGLGSAVGVGIGPDGEALPPLQRRLTLREALRDEAEECRRVQKTDPARAEVLVRLYRRVEASLAVVPTAAAVVEGMLQAATAVDLEGLGLGAGGESIGDAIAAAAVADAMVVDTVGLDLGALGSDMGLGGPSSTHGSLDLGADLGADADLFGGLGGSGMDIDWGDTMDLV